jgi:hypothetical protein
MQEQPQAFRVPSRRSGLQILKLRVMADERIAIARLTANDQKAVRDADGLFA